jgi:hypothetical protein
MIRDAAGVQLVVYVAAQVPAPFQNQDFLAAIM